ncbi:RNA polymerase sigma factor SigJ [Streptomyces sp. NBC_01803]|uniref:RNA polymerase sigma factor SigJ n=1 Tax=Streptomyces sp. NBC_01803 TaxID=2975946 RepID=UPI002DDBFA16|nr:RNA polymerase sigma factor SigJ [Streptomyces sp. NBC_01803]WSA47006.1 RNA polymerase sigma factor SigJ [Streptomyces sp. NBC_01803]
MSDTPAADSTDSSLDAATSVFVGHRELLFSIVYNMLGSVADTEDVLQETWLSWARASARPAAPEIDNPRAYLVRIAVNQALARQAAISRRREAYVGPWLPEPLVADTSDAGDRALRTESVSMAVLVVLETLTPLERAVFVLHEVFGYAHAEIAGILDRSPSAVRQLAHRAREHVHARRPRFRADPALQRQVTERFVAAALGGDIDSLLRLLAPDVTMWTDGGGKVRSAALRPVTGREKVARLMAGYASRPPAELRVRYGRAGGDQSAVVFSGDTPFAVVVMDLTPEGDQVREIYAVTNPEKLARVQPAGAPERDQGPSS